MDDLVSIKYAAAYLGVQPHTLRRWEKLGRIRPLRTAGKHRRYRLSDLKATMPVEERVRDKPHLIAVWTIENNNIILQWTADNFPMNKVASAIDLLSQDLTGKMKTTGYEPVVVASFGDRPISDTTSREGVLPYSRSRVPFG